MFNLIKLHRAVERATKGRATPKDTMLILRNIEDAKYFEDLFHRDRIMEPLIREAQLREKARLLAELKSR
jgi:hypothetical protein